MSLLGLRVIVQSFPRTEDYAQRAGMVTADLGGGLVDVIVFNSCEDIRDLSMPACQALGNLPLLEPTDPYPTDYRGRWVAVRIAESAASASAATVAKPIPTPKPKR